MRTKTIDVYVSDDAMLGGMQSTFIYSDKASSIPKHMKFKAKLVIELPETPISITPSVFKEAYAGEFGLTHETHKRSCFGRLYKELFGEYYEE